MCICVHVPTRYCFVGSGQPPADFHAPDPPAPEQSSAVARTSDPLSRNNHPERRGD